ncbi:MAG: hypothetical protein Q9163_000047 [Psora crenata]
MELKGKHDSSSGIQRNLPRQQQMAAALHRLSFTAFKCTYRTPVRRKAIHLKQSTRQFHRSPIYRARNDDDDDGEDEAEEDRTPFQPPADATREPFDFDLKDLAPEERTVYESLPPSEQTAWREEARQMHEYMSQPHIVSEMTGEVSKLANEYYDEIPRRDIEPPRIKPGLMAMGEDDEQAAGEDPEFEGDDITSLAHGELEQHREMREYARLAVWELPLLYKLAKPFSPPSHTHPLRFRYTTYMGETHPAEKKVVVEFCTRDIAHLTDLTEPQRIKLIKLVGVRYNPDTDVVKMSSETFETQAQNKRYLVDLVGTLVKEAKNEEDMFEDVPLDFRHHRTKKRLAFPEEWKLTGSRRQQLFLDRKRRQEVEMERVELGRLVEGDKVVEEAMSLLPLKDDSRLLVEQQQHQQRQQGKGGRTPRLR